MVARLYQYELPTRIPKYPLRKGLILQWNSGWGEISPLPGWSHETLNEAREEILQHLPRLQSAKPILPSVRFGLACASIPFSLEPVRIPLCALNPSPDFPASIGSTVKLKLKDLSLDEAIHRVKQFRGRYRIRVDCNRAWNLEQALAFAKHFKADDFEYLEDPVHDFEDLIRFSETTRFPIAIDDSVSTLPIHKIPTLKAIVVKPTLIGSIPACPPPIYTVLSSSYETGLGLLHIARLAIQHNFTHPIGLDTYRLLTEDLLSSPIDTSSGYFSWKPHSDTPINLSKLCLIASVP